MAPDPFALVIAMKGRPYAKPRGRTIPGRKRPVSLTGKAKVYATALQRVARGVVLAVGEDAVRQAFAGRALSVAALWVFPTPRPDRWGRPHTHRPDKDNLDKMLWDCLAKAGALGGDDCRIADGPSRKQWGPTGWVAVEVRVLSEDGPPVRIGLKDRLSSPPEWLR